MMRHDRGATALGPALFAGLAAAVHAHGARDGVWVELLPVGIEGLRVEVRQEPQLGRHRGGAG